LSESQVVFFFARNLADGLFGRNSRCFGYTHYVSIRVMDQA